MHLLLNSNKKPAFLENNTRQCALCTDKAVLLINFTLLCEDCAIERSQSPQLAQHSDE